MGIALGDYRTNSVVDFHFQSHKADGTPATLSTAPAISVYQGNSNTQSTDGVTLDVDFDSVTGFNHCTINTASNTTFYAAGRDFSIVLTAGTVDSVSVAGAPVGRFTIWHSNANVQTVNNIVIGGAGTSGSPWGPA